MPGISGLLPSDRCWPRPRVCDGDPPSAGQRRQSADELRDHKSGCAERPVFGGRPRCGLAQAAAQAVAAQASLLKVSALEVAAVGAEDRGAALTDAKLRIWVGLLEPGLEEAVDYVSTETDSEWTLMGSLSMAKIGSGFKVMMERETCAAAARPSRGPTADDREAKRPRPGREEAWRSPGAAEGKRVSQLGSGRGQGRAGCWCQQRWTD